MRLIRRLLPVLIAVTSLWTGGRLGLCAIPAAEQIRVALPAGWEDGGATSPPAIQFGKNSKEGAFFQLIVEAKSDFAASIDLKAYARKVKANSAKSSRLLDRSEMEMAQKRIAARDTMEWEVLGEFKETKLHYRHIVLACGQQSWCQLVCWAVPSHWEGAQREFDALVKNLP